MPISPFVAALLLTGVQCGPTDQEVAGAVLITAPAAMVLGWLLFKALYALVRRRRPSVRWDQRPVLVAIALSVVVAIATALALSHTRVDNVVAAALWAFGTSYLALLAVVWAIWARFQPGRAFTWAWLPVVVLQLAPAVLVAAKVMPADWIAVLWIWPGYFGLVTIVAVAFAWMEARRSG